MTIIKPNKKHYGRFLAIIFSLILIGGLFYIFEYNSFVNTRYQVKLLKQGIIEAEAANADLKNELYKIIDPSSLEKLAVNYQLVLDKNPEYLRNRETITSSTVTSSL